MSALPVIYDGFAFQEGEEEQALPGRFRFTFGGLQFEHASGTLELPLSRLLLDQNSAGNLVFHDAGTGWWVESSDARILNDVFLLRQTHLRAQARQLRERREGNRSLKYALIFLTGFAAVFFIGWLLVKAAANSLANHAPVAWEEHLTDKVIAEHPKLFVTDTNDARIPVVTQLVARLAAALPPAERRYQFRAALIDRPVVNAFALPGGYIFVSRSLVELCERNQDEVAFILGHEMSHVIRGHAMDRIITNSAISLGTKFTSVRGPITALLNNVGVRFLESSYSQELEMEADKLGVRLVVAAGYNAKAAAVLLSRLAKLNPSGAESNFGHYFSSHPSINLRIQNIS